MRYMSDKMILWEKLNMLKKKLRLPTSIAEPINFISMLTARLNESEGTRNDLEIRLGCSILEIKKKLLQLKTF